MNQQEREAWLAACKAAQHLREIRKAGKEEFLVDLIQTMRDQVRSGSQPGCGEVAAYEKNSRSLGKAQGIPPRCRKSRDRIAS
jgi:hypothetical protein